MTSEDTKTTERTEGIPTNVGCKSVKSPDTSLDFPKNEDQSTEGGHVEDITIYVIFPGIEFKVPGLFSALQTVEDVISVMGSMPECFHITSYFLTFNGRRLYGEQILGEIDGLVDKCEVRAVKADYLYRDAAQHLERTLSILESPFIQMAENVSGENRGSFSVFTKYSEGVFEAKRKDDECFSGSFYNASADRVYPERFIKSLTTLSHCVKHIKMSDYHPPPGYRKLMGDLFYLEVCTLEDRYLGVTAHKHGFFVNSCTSVGAPYREAFKPEPHPTIAATSHNLIGLLKLSCPLFVKKYDMLLRFYQSEQMEQNYLLPFSRHEWCVPEYPHTSNYCRGSFVKGIDCENAGTERRLLLGPNYTEEEGGFSTNSIWEMRGQKLPLRDWNEEWQTCQEFPCETKIQNIQREKIRHSCYSRFALAALEGAKAVVDGHVHPVRRLPSADDQTYVWNNIYFHFSVTKYGSTKEEFDSFLPTSYKNVVEDLKGTLKFSEAGSNGLYFLETVLVDYKGKRVICQSLFDGVLKSPNDIVYGTVDEGDTILSKNMQYCELIEHLEDRLHLKRSTVEDKQGNSLQMITNINAKGMVGWDKRPYLIDLGGHTPIDCNFIDIETGKRIFEDYITSRCFLRYELVEIFFETKFVPHLQKALEDAKEDDDQIELQKKAEENFRLNFNVNILARNEKSKEDIAEITEIGHFLKDVVIFRFVKEMASNSIRILDGAMLCDFLHERGVNFRYLGLIAGELKGILTSGEDHFPGIIRNRIRLCESEMISRCLKHLLKLCFQSDNATECICHILKCMFENVTRKSLKSIKIEERQYHPFDEPTFSEPEEVLSDAEFVDMVYNADQSSRFNWMSVTSSMVQRFVYEDAKRCFNYSFGRLDLEKESLRGRGLEPRAILRRVCQMMGVQLKNKDYYMDAHLRSIRNFPLTEDVSKGEFKDVCVLSPGDIVDIYPVGKYAEPSCKEGDKWNTLGKHELELGNWSKAAVYLSMCSSEYVEVLGMCHKKVADCYSALAKAVYNDGRIESALALQRKAIILFEKCCGTDSYQAIGAYKQMALYCCAADDKTLSIWYFARVRVLLLRSFGHNHPELTDIYYSLAILLKTLAQYELSVLFMRESNRLSEMCFGNHTVQFAENSVALAQCYYFADLFKEAVEMQKEATRIFSSISSDDPDLLKKQFSLLRAFTEKSMEDQKHRQRKGEKKRLSSSDNSDDRSIQDLLKFIEGDAPTCVKKEKKKGGK